MRIPSYLPLALVTSLLVHLVELIKETESVALWLAEVRDKDVPHIFWGGLLWLRLWGNLCWNLWTRSLVARLHWLSNSSLFCIIAVWAWRRLRDVRVSVLLHDLSPNVGIGRSSATAVDSESAARSDSTSQILPTISPAVVPRLSCTTSTRRSTPA